MQSSKKMLSFFKHSLMLFLIFPGLTLADGNIPIPHLKADVAVQGEKFFGDQMGSFAGYNTPDSRYAIRHASIGAYGDLNEYIDFEITAGSATCLAGGQFSLMDAMIFLHPTDYFKFGFIKGEILKGFAFESECTDMLSAEKPRFSKTFSPCHPTGAMFEFDLKLDAISSIRIQGALLNGELTQTLEEEYDANLGIHYITPINGVEISGYFNQIKKNYGLDQNFENINDAGTRFGIGAKYETSSIHLQGEFYKLIGYYNNPASNTLYEDNSNPSSYIESKDLEMNAFYVQAGYTFLTNSDRITYWRPYTRYQLWDKGVNADGDYKFTYFTVGVALGLDNLDCTLFRIDYETPIGTPDGFEEDAGMLVVRLQTAFDFHN